VSCHVVIAQVEAPGHAAITSSNMKRSKIFRIGTITVDRARSADAYWPSAKYPIKAKEWHGGVRKGNGRQ